MAKGLFTCIFPNLSAILHLNLSWQMQCHATSYHLDKLIQFALGKTKAFHRLPIPLHKFSNHIETFKAMSNSLFIYQHLTISIPMPSFFAYCPTSQNSLLFFFLLSYIRFVFLYSNMSDIREVTTKQSNKWVIWPSLIPHTEAQLCAQTECLTEQINVSTRYEHPPDGSAPSWDVPGTGLKGSDCEEAPGKPGCWDVAVADAPPW